MSLATHAGGFARAVSTPDQPIQGSERLIALDFIRGIAVLGILLTNIAQFGQAYISSVWPLAMSNPGPVDEYYYIFQLVGVDGKFRGLFSLLFGAGVYIFMERAWSRGSSRWLQFRRLLWLALFGLGLFFLVWKGEILTSYALWGIVILPLLRLPAKWQLAVGLAALSLGAVLAIYMLGNGYARERGGSWTGAPSVEGRANIERIKNDVISEAASERELFANSSYPQLVEHRLQNNVGELVERLILGGIIENFGMILTGAALYRLGFFGGAWDRARMLRLGWIGIIFGSAISLTIALWVYRSGFPFVQTVFAYNALNTLGRYPVVFGLLAVLTCIGSRSSTNWLGERLCAAGRVAFSNYVGSAVLLMLLFNGWAIGLHGKLDRFGLLAILLATWVLMLVASHAWLSRYRYGPLEWVWRCLTYWKSFPLRNPELG